MKKKRKYLLGSAAGDEACLAEVTQRRREVGLDLCLWFMIHILTGKYRPGNQYIDRQALACDRSPASPVRTQGTAG